MTILGHKEGVISEAEEDHILKHFLDLKDKTVLKSALVGEYLRSNYQHLIINLTYLTF